MVDVPEPQPISFWRELIREYQPELNDKEINHVLAEHTSWPLASTEVITQQIAEYMAGMGYGRITNGK